MSTKLQSSDMLASLLAWVALTKKHGETITELNKDLNLSPWTCWRQQVSYWSINSWNITH